MLSVTSFGALPNVEQVQTTALQAALDAAAEDGGGVVVVPPGVFRTGTLVLRDFVTLHLESGAQILGSADLEDYPSLADSFVDAVGQVRGRCLLFAHSIRGAAITGQGTFHGNGGAWAKDHPGRPFLLRFVDCQDIQVTGVTLKDSPGWVSHFLGCENVLLQAITIHSHVNSNNDGIDIDSCSRVRILGCDIDTGDDAICIKATRSQPCENIVVTGCVIRSVWGALKIGTESAGDIRNISFSDIIIRDTEGGGLKIISMDGANIENVQVSNVIMDNVSGPMFIRLGSRLRTYYNEQAKRPVGSIKNVSIRGVTMKVWENGYWLYDKYPRKAGVICSGIPGHALEEIVFENLRICFPGGEKVVPRLNVPELEAEYPEFPVFHPLPAWGFYLRHASGVTFRDVSIQTRSQDDRAPFYAQNAKDLNFRNVRVNGEQFDRELMLQRGV